MIKNSKTWSIPSTWSISFLAGLFIWLEFFCSSASAISICNDPVEFLQDSDVRRVFNDNIYDIKMLLSDGEGMCTFRINQGTFSLAIGETKHFDDFDMTLLQCYVHEDPNYSQQRSRICLAQTEPSYYDPEANMDLSEYPRMFIGDGFDGIFVIDSDASVDITMSMVNMATGVQQYNVIDGTVVMISNGQNMYDDEVRSHDMDIISIGSPCENDVTAWIVGTSDCDYMLGPSDSAVAILKEYNGNVHLAVYGRTDQATKAITEMFGSPDSLMASGTVFKLDMDYRPQTAEAIPKVVHECDFDDDCQDTLSSTKDLCQLSGDSRVCVHTTITGCIQGDGYCPSACSYPQDTDCDECVPGDPKSGLCDDNEINTYDLCKGSPARCQHELITECNSGDMFCPSGCTHLKDADCDECHSNFDCDDDDVCTEDTCDGSPTRCNSRKTGCRIENQCVMPGEILSGKFCSGDLDVRLQKAPGGSCQTANECLSGICQESACKRKGMVESLIAFLADLIS